ncbi:MAG: ArsA family ATPase [Candidatus Asgardarchaeia archaeon]
MTVKDLLEKQKVRFLLFGGKGGVGKTSCAAASALYSARMGNETLIISTDPAHSLSDSFATDLSGGDILEVPGVKNLYAQEINPKRAIEEFKEKYGEYSMEEGMMPVPILESGDDFFPGMDEAIAFTKVLELMQRSEYDVVIFDTAPTGHTLRLLSLPDVLDSMVGKLIKLQIRIKNLFAAFKRMFGGGGEKDQTLEYLDALKQTIGEAKKVLSDHNETSFIPVLIPTMMAIEETERLLQALYMYDIPVSNIIVNMVYPKNPSCPFCMARYDMERSNVEKIKELYEGEFDLTFIPLLEYEVRGIDKLEKFGKYIFCP